MSEFNTVSNDIVASEWRPVTEGTVGTLFLASGKTTVLTQSNILPITALADTPPMDELEMGVLRSRVYHAVPEGYKIYARTVSGTSKITNTPGEE